MIDNGCPSPLALLHLSALPSEVINQTKYTDSSSNSSLVELEKSLYWKLGSNFRKMFLTSTRRWGFLILHLFISALLVEAHFRITYPQQRPYVYHTQFQFPCGGVAPTTNRTAWPTNGGALSLIPIHPFALMTVNIALGNSINEDQDSNPYNVPMVPLFNQTGANSTFCIPKIKIPKSIAAQVKAGVNATIQVVQLTATNAALYGCIDLTFSDKEADRFGNPAVWNQFCFNGTGMGAKALASTGPSTNGTITSAGMSLMPSSSLSSLIVGAVVSLWLWIV